MRQIIGRIRNDYFGPQLSLQAQVFHLLGCAGIAAGLLVAVSSLLTNAGAWNVGINLLVSVFAILLLRFARRTGKYPFCYLLVTIIVFLVAFPLMFFTAGGYRSGMPGFFVMALIFTLLMLQGWTRVGAIAMELAAYIGSCLLAYFHPQMVAMFETEAEYMADVIVGMIIPGALLGGAVILYMRMYNNRQAVIMAQTEKLAAQNRELEQYRVSRGPLVLEIAKSRACVGESDIQLTQKEFAILLLLVQNEERGMTADEIYEAVWGMSAHGDTKAVRNHISSLRHKLDGQNAGTCEITFRNGVGYRLLVWE